MSAGDCPPAVPEIPVKDLSAAVTYYREQLGFTLDWCDDELGLAGVSRDRCRLFLANGNYRKLRGNSGPVLTWLNCDGKPAVDILHRDWQERGAHLLAGPESKPWGLHEFTAADLDGNVFRVFYDFATPERDPPR